MADTAHQKTEPNPLTLSGRLVRIGAMRDGLLVAGGILYVLGYLTWSLYAWETNLGLLPALESQYFIAGIFPALIISAFYLGIRRILGLADRLATWAYGSNKHRRGRYVDLIFSVLAGVGILYAMNFMVYPPLINVPYLWNSRIGAATLLLFMFVFFFLSTIRTRHVQSRIDRVFDAGMLILIPVPFVLLLLSFYLKFIFPIVPQAMGGVRPRCARLDLEVAKISPDTFALLYPAEGSSLPAVAATPLLEGKSSIFPIVRSSQVDVLFSGDRSLLVKRRNGNSTVYEIKQGAIQAVEWCDKEE